MKRKRIVVLGATGSIGESAAKVARDIPERVEIVGIAANSKARELAAQANELRPAAVCIVDETKLRAFPANPQSPPDLLARHPPPPPHPPPPAPPPHPVPR